jgi:Icc protein
MFSENDTGGEDADGSRLFPGGGVTLARFDRPRGSGTTVAVLSDPHLTPTARGSMKLYHRTKQRFEMAVADAHRLDVDGVVVAGDLTKDGTPNEYMLGDSLVGTLPEPTVAVPGNHDVGPEQALGSGTAFARRYGHDDYPVTKTMGDMTVCGIDSTCPGSDRHGGGVGREPLSTLIDTPASGGRIAVMHHPLAPVPEPFDAVLPETDYRIRDPETTADALVDAGVELVVTGHLHWPFATTYRGLNVVGAPGCSTFPPSYLLVRVDSSGTTVSLVPLVGEQGLAEAYEFAVADDSRGPLVRAVVEDGYFGRFPQVGQQRVSGPTKGEHNEHPPTPAEYTGSRTPPEWSG